MKTLISSVLLCATLIASGAAQAALIDRGGGLIYDSDLNITWLQDAFYAKTSGYSSDGRMTWGVAVTWASNLNYYDTVRNVTLTGWRLPTTAPVNGTAFNYDSSYNGSTDWGYNVSEQSTAYAGSTGSEMAHLFYNSLNNKGYCDPGTSTVSVCNGPQLGSGLTNTGPFINVQVADYYWSGTGYAMGIYPAWAFHFGTGGQLAGSDYNVFSSWAVRNGDVAAVPVPSAAWLFGSGLISLVGFARKRTKPCKSNCC